MKRIQKIQTDIFMQILYERLHSLSLSLGIRMEPHPLVSSFTARIQFLGKVSQVVVVVEVAEGNQILEEN